MILTKKLIVMLTAFTVSTNLAVAHDSVEPSATRWEHLIINGVNPELSISVKESSASGLAVVWARENTREEICDAMQRRETYATTGNRIAVRVFGGWDFTADEVGRPDMPRVGYARVIEIPKPRWITYDAAFVNVDMGEDTKMAIQDRAYTSPIWYTP